MISGKRLEINVVRKSRDELIFIFAVIAGLILLEAWALHLGFNGQLSRAVTMIIACLAGITIPNPHLWEKLKKIKELI